MKVVWRFPLSGFLYCLLSAAGWVAVPWLFQCYLNLIIERSPLAEIGRQGLSLFLLVGFLFILDYRRLRLGFKKKLRYQAESSLPAKLAQDRLWGIDLPNFISNTMTALGALAVLSLRDFSMAILVLFWFCLSFVLQNFFNLRVKIAAVQLRDQGNRETEAFYFQSEVLRWQILGSGVSSVLKIGGQLLIYAILLGWTIQQNPGETKKILPILLTNIEYIGLIFASFQAVSAAMPKLKELEAYV